MISLPGDLGLAGVLFGVPRLTSAADDDELSSTMGPSAGELVLEPRRQGVARQGFYTVCARRRLAHATVRHKHTKLAGDRYSTISPIRYTHYRPIQTLKATTLVLSQVTTPMSQSAWCSMTLHNPLLSLPQDIQSVRCTPK